MSKAVDAFQFCLKISATFRIHTQKRKLKGLTYEDLKNKLIERFDRNITKREFIRSRQGKEESCFEFFTRMQSTGMRIIEDDELILEIALLGCFKYKEEMETLALDFSSISEEFLEKVKKLEMIKKESWLRRKPKQENFKQLNNQRSTINNVENSENLIKEDRIYLQGNMFRLIIDTGSCYSFITKKVLQKLKVSTIKMEHPIKLLTCLLEEFIVDTYVELDFCLQKKNFRSKFYVLPNEMIMWFC
ncbi:hypothetical protein NBO_83g0011 [Nosema bombycis CQ1]|uniref:Uncharacterized protein n=1 Tax=Nosema bombycis (strain CQ1 / CVCC 102059) TaxID=578461 RepID=R0KSV5_NOSB1|nr:hypothetical protein NBO_83g0011 [Nosema bombycis CQ1]|eukprot:EOB13307.1 hypothetical protein NBO_83g0011 [Nosema bombycis CQ1]